jgi:hypothetical protein
MMKKRSWLIHSLCLVAAFFIGCIGTQDRGLSPSKPFDAASPVAEGTIVQDWYLTPYQMLGPYADALGSEIDAAVVTGPDGRAALKLASVLVKDGWCGVGRGIAVDISRSTALRFFARSSVDGTAMIQLKDAYNVMYNATFKVASGDWHVVTVPLASFKEDRSYRPPGARPGHPLDLVWTTGINIAPQIRGRSVLEIGQVVATGTGGAFFDPALRAVKPESGPVAVKIRRAGGTPISPFAFGNCYFDWVDWKRDGMVGLKGTEKPVKAMGLNTLFAAGNMTDANVFYRFSYAEIDKYIQYCRAVGAEPVMIAPVFGNNVDGGPATAQGAADLVTYVNGTKKYGVTYWSIGDEVDIYNIYFRDRKDLPVSTVDQYAALYNSFARAMKAANEKAKSGVDIKFVGPELGARYWQGNDWLSPMLDKCKDYIDVVSIHSYSYSARELTAEAALRDIERFADFVRNVKDRVARHARPGTPLAITQTNLCYDSNEELYTPETRAVGPGTFYAAIWDADHVGAALEENLWSYALYALAESVHVPYGIMLASITTDPSQNPPTWQVNPEYHAQQMIYTAFSGTSIKPSGVPDQMSVYASYDVKKSSTAVLVLNKSVMKRVLSLEIEGLPPRIIPFAPLSINIVTVPDDVRAGYHLVEYTKEMADAGRPPEKVR